MGDETYKESLDSPSLINEIMHLRLKDQKVVKAVKKDAKARKCSCARAAEIALEVHYLMAKTYYPIQTKAKP